MNTRKDIQEYILYLKGKGQDMKGKPEMSSMFKSVERAIRLYREALAVLSVTDSKEYIESQIDMAKRKIKEAETKWERSYPDADLNNPITREARGMFLNAQGMSRYLRMLKVMSVILNPINSGDEKV